MLASVAVAAVALLTPPAIRAPVASWYDSGIRLGYDVLTTPPAMTCSIQSWYDSGIRLEPTNEDKAYAIRQAFNGRVAAERAAKAARNLGQRITEAVTSVPIADDAQIAKDVGNAVGLLTGVGAAAALGLDVASLDLDILVLAFGVGAAVVAEEDQGAIGSSFRTVGNVASPVLNVTKTAADANT